MKKNKSKIVLFCMLSLIILFLGTQLKTQNVNASTIKLNKTTKTMRVGQTFKLKVTGTKKTIKWATSNKKIATVSSKGNITAKAKGEVEITAKVDKKTLTCKVTVKPCKLSQKMFAYERDSVDGIEVQWIATNNTGKIINYYTVYFQYFNAVGDPAYDELTGESTGKIKYVGPVEKGNWLVVGKTIGYIPALHKIKITKVDLEYKDGTTETIQYNKSTTKNKIDYSDMLN